MTPLQPMKLFYQLFIASLQGTDPEVRLVFELLAAGAVRAPGDAQGYRVEALVIRFRLPRTLVSDALAELTRLGMLRSTYRAAAASRNLLGTQRYLLKTA